MQRFCKASGRKFHLENVLCFHFPLVILNRAWEGTLACLLQRENLKSLKLQNSSAMYTKVKSFSATFCIFRPEGDRSESEIEDEEAFEMDSDGSEESSLRVPISTNSSLPVIKISTPQAGGKAGETFASLVEILHL